MDLTALLHKLCDGVLEKPMREPERKPRQKISAHDACLLPAREVKPNHKVVSTRQTAAKSKAQIRREVWRRDQAQCSNCGSTYALEKDHIHPRALGGLDTVENLRLLCRCCNQRAAIKMLGQSRMETFLSPLQGGRHT